MTTEPICIVGGGVIGLMAARELHLAGCEVVVLERGDLGQESSWAGGGILSPLHPWRYAPAVNELARWGQAQYEAFADALRASSGVDPEWERSGMLVYTREADRAIAWGRQTGAPLERGRGPCFGADPGGAEESVWMPEVAQVRPPRLLRALVRDVAARGVELRPGVEVRSFVVKDGRLHGLMTAAGESVSAGACLLTAGAWSGDILASTGLRLPIKPMRGQMIAFRARPGLLGPIVLKGDRYLIPRRDGLILCGSTLEDVGYERNCTEEGFATLRAAAIDLLPALADCPVRHHWAGLRPGSPDGIPYIGQHPAIRGLFVCAGHFRNGIVLAPGSARLSADLLLGRPPLLDPQPYGLDRV